MTITNRDIDVLRDSIEHMNDDDCLVFYSNGEQITYQKISEIIDRVSTYAEPEDD